MDHGTKYNPCPEWNDKDCICMFSSWNIFVITIGKDMHFQEYKRTNNITKLGLIIIMFHVYIALYTMSQSALQCVPLPIIGYPSCRIDQHGGPFWMP